MLCFGTAVCSHPSVHKQPIANVSAHSALGKLLFHWGCISRDSLFLCFPQPMRHNQKNKTIFIIYLFVLTLLSLSLISFCEAWSDSPDLPDGQCSQIYLDFRYVFDTFEMKAGDLRLGVGLLDSYYYFLQTSKLQFYSCDWLTEKC